MNYKNYVTMLRRSKERVIRLMDNIDDALSMVNVGIELRHMEALADEAYDLGVVSYNSYMLLRRWARRYNDKIKHDIIWR